MPITNFPNGVSSWGVPVLPGLPLPFTGNYYFVDPVNGSDGGDGSLDSPYQHLSTAHSVCTAGNNDVVMLIGNGALSGSARESATLAWSKNATHLVGIAAPTENFGRARIAATSGTTFTPLVNVTASGCMFMNISAYHGYNDASAQICWTEAGQRNFYGNCSFYGMADATAAAQTGGRSLKVGTSGQGENTFYRCTIGLDTVARTAANASLEFAGGTPRNVFRECNFTALVTGGGSNAVFILAAAASSMDRWQLFQDCSFINCVKSTGSAMTGACSIAASSGGLILLQRSTFVGCTDIEAAASNEIFIDGGPPTAATTALAVNNA